MKRRDRIDTSGQASDSLDINPFGNLSSEGLPEGTKRTERKAAVDSSRSSKAGKRGRVDIRREKKGRGGKTVTTLTFENLRDPNQLNDICKQLQSQLGIGGSVKQGVILLQGDVRDRITGTLESKGFRAVLSGG